VATVAQPDRLPAVPFVDQVFTSSFNVHPPRRCGGSDRSGTADRAGDLGQATAGAGRGGGIRGGWLAIAAAAALGNYPTPVVGYGGSAIVVTFSAWRAAARSVPDRREAAA
jgi:hypothetical protein